MRSSYERINKISKYKRIFLCFFSILLCLLCVNFAGCASKEKSDLEPQQVTLTGILLPTAEFTQVKAPFTAMTEYCWIGDTLVYQEEIRSENNKGVYKNNILQVPIDASQEPEIVQEMNWDKEFLYCFFSDREDNLYFFGMRKADEMLYLKKINAQKEEVYCNYFDMEIIAQPGFISSGFADSKGNIILLARDGSIYFFNANGEYLNSSSTFLTQGKLLDTGEGGIYLWQIDNSSAMQDTALLQKLDMERGTVAGTEQSFSLKNFQKESKNSCVLLSGYEQGLLISAEDTLWQYNMQTKESKEILNWSDSHINIQGSNVEMLRLVNWQSIELEGMEVLLYDFQSEVAETAEIISMDKAYLPEKQSVVLGVSPYSNMNRLVLGFNRNNHKYQLELVEYNDNQLEEAMMYGKGQIPDILDICWITPELLANKGLLEDLELYFKESDMVSKEDILPAVWEGNYINNKVIGAITSFSIGTLLSSAQEPSLEGWTIEQFFDLEKNYPDSLPLEYYYDFNVWRILSASQLDSYIDWEAKKCSFDSEEFISLLENISRLNLKNPSEDHHPTSYSMEKQIEDLKAKEFLLYTKSYGSPYDYHTDLLKMGLKAKVASYPTRNGDAFYILNPSQQFAIYSNSSCKEGAWEFIEYLLSEEEQNWYGNSYRGFPVRTDSFQAYLDKPYSQSYTFQNDNVSEEEKEQLRYMTENMYMSQDINSVSNNTINDIIYEEIAACCAKDKTAKEAAEIIQNRVQLFFNEM